MRQSAPRARAHRRALATIGVIATGMFAVAGFAAERGSITDEPLSAELAFVDSSPAVAIDDSLFGLSGKLRMRFLAEPTGEYVAPVLQRLLGHADVRTPGIHRVDDAERPFSFVTLLPFTEKQNGRIGTYRIGSWPGEHRRSPAGYENPEGFIVVTPENQNEHVSEHFRLRDFLTKDQRDVWPKYLVLDLRLIDKLELVIDELRRTGVDVRRMAVMSGFRTPQYNANGGITAGRASLSRHMFGDAADVFVDNNGNGRMDDLNGDGRVDHRDAQLIIDAAARVERKHPALVGGAGLYRANASHGPFAHVDVRGTPARWGVGL